MSTTSSETKNLDNLNPEQIFIAFSNLTSQNVEPNSEPILEHYSVMNKKLGISHLSGFSYYRKLQEHIDNNLRAKAMWEILNKKSANRVYNQQHTCQNQKIAIIGAGPIGLRMAIEGLLLGAEVHVIEKRISFTRNNVAHLWHFTIEDFKMLGVKKLYGGFCAGNINHISIRRIQCIFLQISLILGVQFHAPLEYVDIIEPDEGGKHKWRLKLDQPDHPVAELDFDFIIAADGARTKFRTLIPHTIKPGKLCLGITANFVNMRTQKEMEVQSIAGVAAIYDQQFFRSLKSEKDIELENIVYYKDDTHYFVMTARKKNLLAKKVFVTDGKELGDLCRRENIDYPMLIEYVKEVNDFATGLEVDFYIKRDGRPDVSLFDFSRRAVSTNACRMFQRHGATMTVLLVGDSLIEPFWPLGTGLALGVLAVLDAAWFIKGFAEAVLSPLELIVYRESLFKLLNSEFNSNNLLKPFSNYTIDPSTRYPNFQLLTKVSAELQQKYKFLFVKDIGSEWQGVHTASTTAINLEVNNNNTVPNRSVVSNKPKNLQEELQSKFKDKPAQQKNSNIATGQITQMQNWFKEALADSSIHINKGNFWATFTDGNAFAYIISRFKPDLLDFKDAKEMSPHERLEKVFKIADEHFGISPVFNASKFLFHPDQLEVIYYLLQWYDYFKNEALNSKYNTISRLYNRLTKRKHGGTKRDSKPRGDSKSLFANKQEGPDTLCRVCNKFIYTTEKISAEGLFFHRTCFTCEFKNCNTQLTSNNCSVYHNEDLTITFLCPYHFSSIESADFATGCHTLKHVKNRPHLTTEQIASTASDIRNRSITVDQSGDSPVKQVLPILSNKSSKKRPSSQPILDSPTLPQRPIADPEPKTGPTIPIATSPVNNTESSKPITHIQKPPTPEPPLESNKLVTALQKQTGNTHKPTETIPDTVPFIPVKPSKYNNKVPEPQAVPSIPYRSRQRSTNVTIDNSPVLPRVTPNDKTNTSPPVEKVIQNLVSPSKLIGYDLKEGVSLRTQSQPGGKPQKKSSYEPNLSRSRVRAVTNHFQSQQSSPLDDMVVSDTCKPRLSNYPSRANRTSMGNLFDNREENDDVGPNVQVFHRFNIFKAQSSESLLRGSFNSTNEHFNPRAATKGTKSRQRRVTEGQAMLGDKAKRLSQVKEAIEKHPMKSRYSIELQALKAEQSSLESEIIEEENVISRSPEVSNYATKQPQQQPLTQGHVEGAKIQPEICQLESIASIECETPKTEFPPPELLLPIGMRNRLSALGQNSLYRSKRYRSTRIVTTEPPQQPAVSTDPMTLTQSSVDDDETDEAMQAQNQKEQDAFKRAIELDEEMDLLQQRLLLLEEKGKYYECRIRNTDDTNDENMVRYLKEWSDIINSKNSLIRLDRDLSLEFKEFQLRDELFRVENELRKKQETDAHFMGVESKALINEKMTIIEEMDELVAQIDQENIKEREEDDYRKSMLPLAFQSFNDGIMSDAVFVENPKGFRNKFNK